MKTINSIKTALATVALAFCFSLVALGAGTTTVGPKVAIFQWFPNPADFGGLSTNDFYTNLVFRLFSSTSCTTPTNQWTELTNWQASTFPSFDGNWTNYFQADGLTRFYLLSVGVANGNSPFSNLYVSIPVQSSGIVKTVRPYP